MSEGRVIIAGGGPTGMAAALFLIGQRVPVTLIEKSAEAYTEPRAATYHPPSLEMLEASGVTAELHERGIVARHWQFRDRAEGLIAQFDLDVLREDTRYPYRLQCEQHKLVAMMEQRVRASPLASVHRDAEFIGARQDAEGVDVEVRSAKGALSRFRGAYLIGADGGRSAVRKSQGIGFEGFTYPERFLVITTNFDFEPLGFAYSGYTMDPVEWCATFKVPGPDDRGRWRVVFPTDPQADEATLLDHIAAEDRLQRFVRRPGPIGVVHTNLYAVHQRVASAYRRGRVLLAGDAAHVNNPLGGMGLNFGLHDAHSLASRIGAISRSESDLGALDLYERQRRAVAQSYLQSQTIANKQMLEERDEAKREARKAEMRAIAADPVQARRYLRRTSMIEGLEAAAAIA